MSAIQELKEHLIDAIEDVIYEHAEAVIDEKPTDEVISDGISGIVHEVRMLLMNALFVSDEDEGETEEENEEE